MLKYGFKIEDGRVYDTQILEYEIKRVACGSNVHFVMVPFGYKRLYLFEPLLFRFSAEKVFEILKFNKYLRRDRERNDKSKAPRVHHMLNASVVYNYPPTFLTQRKFTQYKLCQKLKKRIA